MAFQAFSRGFRTRDGTVKLNLLLGKHVDKEVGGAASANADDTVAIEAWGDVVHCGFGDGFFQFVLSHGKLPLQFWLDYGSL